MSVWLKTIALSLAFLTSFAHASSRVTDGKERVEPYCELTAYFKKETTNGNRVVWLYDVVTVKKSGRNSQCPPVNETFELSIPMAEYAPENEAKFIYPDFVDVPKTATKQRLRVRRIHVVNAINKEDYVHWIVLNWQQGITNL